MPRSPSTTTIRTGQVYIHNKILCFAYATFSSCSKAFEAEEDMYSEDEISSYSHIGTIKIGNRWAILLRVE